MSNSDMMAVLCAKYNWCVVHTPDSAQGSGNMVYNVQVLRNNMTGFLGDYKRITISPIYYEGGKDGKGGKGGDAPPKQFKITISMMSLPNGNLGDAISVHYMYTTRLESGSLEYIGEYSICCACGDPCSDTSQICSRCKKYDCNI